MTRCRKRAKHISHLPPFRLPALRFGRLGCRPAIKLASDCQVATNDQWRPPVDRQTEDISILLLRMWVNPFYQLGRREKNTYLLPPVSLSRPPVRQARLPTVYQTSQPLPSHRKWSVADNSRPANKRYFYATIWDKS